MKQILNPENKNKMKKIALIFSLIAAIQFKSEAQNILSVAAGSKISFSANNNSTKKIFVPAARYSVNDSTLTVKDHTFYMQKSKNQRTVGLVLLGTGLLASGIGVLVATNANSFNQSETAATCFIIGAATGIASIPLMVLAHVNRNKAKLSLSSQKTGFGIPVKSGDMTGLTLSMNIGR